MIWPADLAYILIGLTGATGQAKGMVVLAAILLWYGAAVGLVGALGAMSMAVARMKPKKNRKTP